MNCPLCDGATSVFESRESPHGKRRRRICSQCKHRFATIEIMLDTVAEHEKLLRRVQCTIGMLEFVRDSCNTAINQLNSMENKT